jgi:hypothetical protein
MYDSEYVMDKKRSDKIRRRSAHEITVTDATLYTLVFVRSLCTVILYSVLFVLVFDSLPSLIP